MQAPVIIANLILQGIAPTLMSVRVGRGLAGSSGSEDNVHSVMEFREQGGGS